MLRLIVNPGTESAWEIPLPPGVISLGRGPENTFPIEHPSVSSEHCQLTVTDSGVVIKDLGSINGTFVDEAMVDEARLANGQTLRLGDVLLRFESDQIPLARPVPGVVVQPQTAAVFCKFHPHALAKFRCPKCQRTFCDLCVSHRQGSYFCRSCSVECSPLNQAPLLAAPEESFFKQARGAFVYPLKGDGLLLLFLGGFLFLLIDGVVYLATFTVVHFLFLYGLVALILLTFFATGYLTRYLQNVLVGSARGENEMPDWPDLSDFSSEVTTPFYQMLGLVVSCFAPAILLAIYAIFAPQGGPWLGWATTASIIFGAAYFPMAFTAVAMFDSVAAVNPLLIVPSILKIPKEYALTIVLFGIVFVLRWLAVRVLPELLGIPYILPAIIGNFFGLYLLVVLMRILGLLYRTKKDELCWSGS
jgi:FHA domain